MDFEPFFKPMIFRIFVLYSDPINSPIKQPFLESSLKALHCAAEQLSVLELLLQVFKLAMRFLGTINIQTVY